jgi:hypothetical protein
MKCASKLSTLFLYANGVGRRVIAIDTVLRGIFGFKDGDLPRALRPFSTARALFAYLRDLNANLSYVADWRDALLRSPALEVEVCNINNLVHYTGRLLRLPKYDLIVIGHSAAGDDMSVLLRSAAAFQRRRGKLVMFIGNEYDILDDKISFIRSTGVDFVCSQLPLEAARYLYQECASARILEMPHALNPERYYPIPQARRDTDVGFIGDIYWPFVGDRERTDLIEWFERNGAARGLAVDIRRQRVSREEWNVFLNGCKAIIGAESGTYYLNDRGRLLDRARAYNLVQDRAATFEDVFARFFAGQPRGISGKSISSRHFEPIGTKTCQILLEGHYNGLLKANVHYIAVKSDLSDIDLAIERFRDEPLRRRMVEETYEYAVAQHTYAHRVAQLLDALG